ncbi:uncharacterized protein LOC143785764 [Ranitomeya variabilis]|uniref:uncharacterized protein LOC143785764 n=1 Tax=Ranitomeya variabilis TaxID=490064 RepID=UPI004056BA98
MEKTRLLLVSLVLVVVGAEDKLPPHVERRIYCETCLATVQELKKAVKVHAAELSRTKIRGEMIDVCKSLKFEEKYLAEARTGCMHLLDVYEDKFEETFLKEKEDAFEANLCYLHTRACIGVKRNSFQEQNQKYEDGIIEFIKNHGDQVRHAKPMAADGSENLKYTKDEF